MIKALICYDDDSGTFCLSRAKSEDPEDAKFSFSPEKFGEYTSNEDSKRVQRLLRKRFERRIGGRVD